ncbi:RES family NAD+ phosphorylase [Salinarimonas ramus]|uniref:RES family NAD+ phosphorylase n=1 Tax=Salinarimonas ramus TaxID=690164 RepID=UPI001AEE7580|nr:RES family NAD+ phosphorylase [Salinarimonas ramus]
MVPAGTRFKRIIWRHFTDPLGCGRSPSRFSDPRTSLPEADRYGVVYLGSSTSVCFLEAIQRDRAVGSFAGFAIGLGELRERVIATIDAARDLAVLDLTGDGLVLAGVPTDAVRASDQGIGQAWSLAIHEHPARLDGILYPSRLNGESNLAVFDRAVGDGLVAMDTRPLLQDTDMIGVLDRFRVTVVPDRLR